MFEAREHRHRPEEPASSPVRDRRPVRRRQGDAARNVADANGCTAVWTKSSRIHDRVRVRRRARRGRRAVHLAARAGHRRAASGGIEVRPIRAEPHHALPPVVPRRLRTPDRATTPRNRRSHRRRRPSPKPAAHSFRSSRLGSARSRRPPRPRFPTPAASAPRSPTARAGTQAPASPTRPTSPKIPSSPAAPRNRPRVRSCPQKTVPAEPSPGG